MLSYGSFMTFPKEADEAEIVW